MNIKHMIGVLVSAILAFATAAHAQDNYYSGKTVTVMIGHKPGGSFDLYAQLTASHLGRFLPGEPNVVVEHRPGGGGSKATAYFYAAAPTDGTVIGIFPETNAHAQLLFPKKAKWDMTKMPYIGSYAPVNPVFVVRKGSPAMTIEDMKKTEIAVGCTGFTSQSCQMPKAMTQFAGMKFKIVSGYKGSAGFVDAMTKGEVDLVSMAWNSWRSKQKDKLESGNYIPVLQGGLGRNPELPDLPLLQEAVDDPFAKEVLAWIGSGDRIGRALIAPPGVESERLKDLKVAFQTMVSDPVFKADADKRMALLIPANGDDLDALTKSILAADAKIIETAKAAYE